MADKDQQPVVGAFSAAATRDPEADKMLDNRPWMKLVEECVVLHDEMADAKKDFDPARREVADHVECRLREILERCGVEVINHASRKGVAFDAMRHKPDVKLSLVPNGALLDNMEITKDGFAVGRRVLSRADVQTGIVRQ